VAESSAALLESNRRRAAEQHRRRAAQWRGCARAAGVRHYQDHAQDRPSQDRVLGAAGPPSLGDRAVAGVAVGYRRLQVRYERRANILLGFLHLAAR
jgi:hypothetical protein